MKRTARARDLVAEAIRIARQNKPRADIPGPRCQASTAEVRDWASANGFQIGADGTIPAPAISAFNQTHPPGVIEPSPGRSKYRRSAKKGTYAVTRQLAVTSSSPVDHELSICKFLQVPGIRSQRVPTLRFSNLLYNGSGPTAQIAEPGRAEMSGLPPFSASLTRIPASPSRPAQTLPLDGSSAPSYSSLMRIRIIDAFTDGPFVGNPAGVCLLDTGPARSECAGSPES